MRILQYLHAAWSAEDVHCTWTVGEETAMDTMKSLRENWNQTSGELFEEMGELFI